MAQVSTAGATSDFLRLMIRERHAFTTLRSPSLFLHSGRPYSLHAAAAPALREPADTTQARLGECRTLADVRRCLEDAESSVGFEDALLGLSIGTAYLRWPPQWREPGPRS